MKQAIALSWPKLKPATEPVKLKEATRCLVIQDRSIYHRKVSDFGEFLRAGDLLVVNDAATIPAALTAETSRGDLVEIRLVKNINRSSVWWALILAPGSWRMKTEARVNIPPLSIGDRLYFDKGLTAQISKYLFNSKRLVEIEFETKNVWHLIYQNARPIQYSYLSKDLELWDPQTIFAGPPVALEAPSASFCLTWNLIDSLKQNGVQLAFVTHATGVSSTGERNLDELLPFPEKSIIPEGTVRLINETKQRNGRVIAVGTGTVRALEGVFPLRPGEFEVTLKITEKLKPQIVSGVLTGLHESESSHLELLSAFARPEVLSEAYRQAATLGYHIHEFGDVNLIIDGKNRT